MGNLKAKTHLEKLGFSENDKKSSKHDFIQLWVSENIEKIISETVMKNNPKPYKILDVKWEHQIVFKSGNYKTLVGFVDIMVRYEGEFYFIGSNQYEKEEGFVMIEVKTEIPNLGELIRQMRAYQSYQAHYRTHYLIIAPDDRFKELLNKQGFYFYKYKDPNLLF